MTQPLYDATQVGAMHAEARRRFGPRGFPIPVLLGILPLLSARHAEFLHNEVPGITIPEGARVPMRGAGDAGTEVGIEIATRSSTTSNELSGTYLMPSFGRYERRLASSSDGSAPATRPPPGSPRHDPAARGRRRRARTPRGRGGAWPAACGRSSHRWCLRRWPGAPRSPPSPPRAPRSPTPSPGRRSTTRRGCCATRLCGRSRPRSTPSRPGPAPKIAVYTSSRRMAPRPTRPRATPVPSWTSGASAARASTTGS